MKRFVWTKEKLKELEALYQKYPIAVCASIMGIDFKVARAAASNHKIHSGRTGDFKPGHVPINKGKKFTGKWVIPTMFKPGHVPVNKLPIGTISERVKSGKPNTMIKIGENKWIDYKRYVWETCVGEIPKGHCVTFIDYESRNFDVSNLRVVSRDDMMRINYNREKASLTLKTLFKRERIRKKYGLAPLTKRGLTIVNY